MYYNTEGGDICTVNEGEMGGGLYRYHMKYLAVVTISC